MDHVMNEDISDDGGTFLFLDFNGKLANDVFDNEVFVRIANLHKNNPLVQVNDSVFKGTYDHSIGINMFFEEIEKAPNDNHPFEKQSLIHLKPVINTTKVISLKQVKIPARKVEVPNETKKIEFKLDWDYKTLLQKFEDGTLQLCDIIKTDVEKMNINEPENNDNEELITEVTSEATIKEINAIHDKVERKITSLEESSEAVNLEESRQAVEILKEDYEKLSALARRPVKRATSPELLAECDTKYKDAFEYHNIEREILKPCEAFRTENITDINEDTLSNCVDIDRCVLYGLIPPSSDRTRILCVEEKQKLLVLDNFENLSFAARYYTLIKHIEQLEVFIKSIPENELKVKDEYGHTPIQTLEIYRKLSEAVKKRLTEIKISHDSEIEVEQC